MRSLCVLITGFLIVKCNILDKTTQIVEENDVNDTKKYVVEDKMDGYVYLDDVIVSLSKQNWSGDEKPCLEHIRRLVYGLQNFTLWAVWNWDAQSSQPQGLLFANRYQLGNYDQCMSAPWIHSHSELATKYCLADIVLDRTDRAVRRKGGPFDPYRSALDFIEYRPPHGRPLNELTWGVCVPSVCEPRSVEKLLGVMLARSHLATAGMTANITVTDCQTSDESDDGDGLYYGFVAMVAILITMSLLCTYINKRCDLDPDKFRTGVIKAFCLRENSINLLNVKKDGVEVLYGIRFLTICLIVLDHQIGINNAGPISDGYSSDQKTHSIVGMLLLHDDLFVDTFFLMSGFLSMTALYRMKTLPNPLLMIVKRYVRLVVALAVVVFYVCAVFPYAGSGPLWAKARRSEVATCRRSWWLNLLMVNNYIDTENICIVASWYIPCDFHFFVATVLLYCVYARWRVVGAVCAAAVTVAAIVTPGVINYVHGLPAIQLFTFQFVVNPRGSRAFHTTYIKSHTRYASYLVGFFAGYVFCHCSARGNLKRISKKWSIIGSVASLIVMLVVLMMGSTFLWRDYHPLEGAAYAALNRPVWASGCAALVLCCSLGTVPLLKGFLSWYPWVPLSRLSYGLYLTHTVIITRNVFATRNPQHNDYFETLNSASGVIVWGCVCALLLWLFAEAPANNLLTVCLRSHTKKLRVKEDSSNGVSPHSTPTTSGQLQANLQTNVQFSSKM